MKETEQDGYDRCAGLVRTLIHEWEKIRPEEELVVMVLPKYDQREREERLGQICEMLLRERWQEKQGTDCHGHKCPRNDGKKR